MVPPPHLHGLKLVVNFRSFSLTRDAIQLAQVGQRVGDLFGQRLARVASQVDARFSDAELQVLPAQLEQLTAILAVPAELERPPDLGGIAPDRAAGLMENRGELFDPLRVSAGDVPDVRVPRHEPESART